MKKAWLKVSPKFLLENLKLPYGTSIETVVWDNKEEDLLFLIDNPDLEDVDDDNIPVVIGRFEHKEVLYIEWYDWEYKK